MLYGKNLRLRAIEREDIPRFVRWLNDPEVRQFLLMHEPLSRAKEERWFEEHLSRTDEIILAIEVLWEKNGSISATSASTASISKTEPRFWGFLSAKRIPGERDMAGKPSG
jgi:RimJ/RimL family protein N-acetyltransferase